MYKPEKFFEWVSGEATIVTVVIIVSRQGILVGHTVIVVQFAAIGVIQQLIRFLYFNEFQFGRWIIVLIRMPATVRGEW